MKDFIKKYNITISNQKITFRNLDTDAETEKLFDLKLYDLHDQISRIEYTKEAKNNGKNVNPEIERFAMPPFVFVFYYLLATNMRIPRPNELMDKYIQLFCIRLEKGVYTFKKEYLTSGDNIKFKYTDVKARMLRAYNSYIREVELFLNLKTELSKHKATIKYNMIDDLYNGVDLYIIHNKKTYCLATYVNTNRSQNYKKQKNKYRHDYTDKNNIDVVATMSGPEKNVVNYGDVMVYNKKTVNEVVQKILEN